MFIKPCRLLIVLLALLGAGHGVSFAGNVYQFKDEQGNVLLTNVVGKDKKPQGERFKTYARKVKVTWYPESNIHTYTDWGKTEAAVAHSASRNKNAYDQIITNAAQRYGVDAGLIKAIMHTESGFNPYARSPVGAQGLMQLMPATARRFGVGNAFDPAQNIEGGVKYLAHLLNRYANDWSKAIAGYNAGEGNVDKYGGIPPFAETQNYVPKVLSRYRNLYQSRLVLNESNTTAPVSVPPSPPSTSSSTKALQYVDGKNNYPTRYSSNTRTYSSPIGNTTNNHITYARDDHYEQSAYDALESGNR